MNLNLTLMTRSKRALLCASLVASGWIVAQPAVAQRINAKLAADAVYSQLPELPQENQYVRRKGNKPAPNSTLVSRLIQYHTQVKGRSPQYRFDWKITLADYLGLYENLREEEYPGQYLKTNPMENDRKLIRQFTRKQRLALTQILSDLYASQAPQQAAPPPEQEKAQPEPTQPAAPEPEPITRPKLVPLPGSGSADLLRPQTTPKSTSPQSTTPTRKPTGESQKLTF